MSLSRISRRNFLLSAGSAGVAAVVGDGVLFEPNLPRISRQEFFLARWPERMDGFTIALLSDFHFDPVFSIHPLRAAIPMVQKIRPDLIALTGDFVSVPLFGSAKKEALLADPCARTLAELSAPHGLWAVLGNHDLDTDAAHITRALETENIHLLRNQSQAIEKDGARIWLAGIDDVLGGAPDLPKTLHGLPSGEAVILLAHEPDYADIVSQYPVDLQLSGHSHGGQIRIPFLPPLYLPELAKKYVWGTYHVGPLTLHTNAGLGTFRIPVRLDCPPEITIVTLRPAKVASSRMFSMARNVRE